MTEQNVGRCFLFQKYYPPISELITYQIMNVPEWNDGYAMTDEQYEKELFLFRSQKQLLDTFLKNGAISQAQYDKSLGDLIRKMGIRDGESE